MFEVWLRIKDRGKILGVFWKQNWARIQGVFHNRNREKIGGEFGGCLRAFFKGWIWVVWGANWEIPKYIQTYPRTMNQPNVKIWKRIRSGTTPKILNPEPNRVPLWRKKILNFKKIKFETFAMKIFKTRAGGSSSNLRMVSTLVQCSPSGVKTWFSLHSNHSAAFHYSLIDYQQSLGLCWGAVFFLSQFCDVEWMRRSNMRPFRQIWQ